VPTLQYPCRIASFTLLLLLAGCKDPAAPKPAAAADADNDRPADVRILFVGNSHTAMHDLPGIVCGMIRFRAPQTTASAQHIFAGFLEDAANNPACREALASGTFTHVVLQAQKISMNGKHEYSRQEGIDLARLGKAHGAAVIFYPEWGLKDVPGDGARQEKVYREMARDAGVAVAPVARAWDLALAARPELVLHAPDGNHQSALGAFLTACVLYGRLTGVSPANLAAYPYPAPEQDRQFLAAMAAQAVSPKDAGGE
jgi:hypothetical protein